MALQSVRPRSAHFEFRPIYSGATITNEAIVSKQQDDVFRKNTVIPWHPATTDSRLLIRTINQTGYNDARVDLGKDTRPEWFKAKASMADPNTPVLNHLVAFGVKNPFPQSMTVPEWHPHVLLQDWWDTVGILELPQQGRFDPQRVNSLLALVFHYDNCVQSFPVIDTRNFIRPSGDGDRAVPSKKRFWVIPLRTDTRFWLAIYDQVCHHVYVFFTGEAAQYRSVFNGFMGWLSQWCIFQHKPPSVERVSVPALPQDLLSGLWVCTFAQWFVHCLNHRETGPLYKLSYSASQFNTPPSSQELERHWTQPELEARLVQQWRASLAPVVSHTTNPTRRAPRTPWIPDDTFPVPRWFGNSGAIVRRSPRKKIATPAQVPSRAPQSQPPSDRRTVVTPMAVVYRSAGPKPDDSAVVHATRPRGPWLNNQRGNPNLQAREDPQYGIGRAVLPSVNAARLTLLKGQSWDRHTVKDYGFFAGYHKLKFPKLQSATNLPTFFRVITAEEARVNYVNFIHPHLSFDKTDLKEWPKDHCERSLHAYDALGILEDEPYYGYASSQLLVSMLKLVLLDRDHRVWLSDVIDYDALDGLYSTKDYFARTRSCVVVMASRRFWVFPFFQKGHFFVVIYDQRDYRFFVADNRTPDKGQKTLDAFRTKITKWLKTIRTMQDNREITGSIINLPSRATTSDWACWLWVLEVVRWIFHDSNCNLNMPDYDVSRWRPDWMTSHMELVDPDDPTSSARRVWIYELRYFLGFPGERHSREYSGEHWEDEATLLDRGFDVRIISDEFLLRMGMGHSNRSSVAPSDHSYGDDAPQFGGSQGGFSRDVSMARDPSREPSARLTPEPSRQPALLGTPARPDRHVLQLPSITEGPDEDNQLLPLYGELDENLHALNLTFPTADHPSDQRAPSEPIDQRLASLAMTTPPRRSSRLVTRAQAAQQVAVQPLTPVLSNRPAPPMAELYQPWETSADCSVPNHSEDRSLAVLQDPLFKPPLNTWLYERYSGRSCPPPIYVKDFPGWDEVMKRKLHLRKGSSRR